MTADVRAGAVQAPAVPGVAEWGWRRALLAALLALAAGGGVVVTAAVALHAGADWFTASEAIEVPSSRLELVRGQGHRAGTALVIESTPDGPAVAVGAVPPFAAENYPRVEWQLAAPRAPEELVFIWRTRERPGRTFTHPLNWTAGGPAPLTIAADENWRGTIVGMGLAMRGPLPGPVAIASVRLPSGAAGATLRALVTQWGAVFPLRGYAVAFPFDRERTHLVPIVPVLAGALALGAGGLVTIARRRGRPMDARVWWLLFAIAWLMLDARWHVNLARAVADTHTRYAGKTMEEKWLAADDAALYRLAREVVPLLPARTARILVLADNPILAVRLGHFLYPQNVYSPLKPPRARNDPHRGAPDHDSLRAGDYVLLFFYGRLRYDPATSNLLWADGHARHVTPLLARPGTLFARVD
ncbi:MAG: hypothetical protein ABI920_03535 [Casimicrobiaceae bacterium]